MILRSRIIVSIRKYEGSKKEINIISEHGTMLGDETWKYI